MKYFTSFLLLLLLLTACEREGALERKPEADYYPLRCGSFAVYEVDEVRYSPALPPSARLYELMVEVVGSIASELGVTYLLQRSQRNDAQDHWVALDTWSVRKTGEGVIVTEGNLPYAKLRFPLRQHSRWDGNTWNDLEEDFYAVTSIDVPAEVGGMSFERTVTIEQEMNDDRIVFRDERTEMYAAGVGLIHQKVVQLTYCTDDACLGQEKVEEGIERTMTIKEYGSK